MAALVCDICGGKLVMQSGGVAKCDSCGMEYTKERIHEKVQEIKGTVKIDGPVETVKGDSEKERLLNMANDCLNKGNLEEAKRIYTTVSKEYSNDWRGWWGIICSTPTEINRGNTGIVWGSNNSSLHHEFEMALSFAPDSEKAKIQAHKQERERYITHNKINAQIKELNETIQEQLQTLKEQQNKLSALGTRNSEIVLGVISPIVFIIVVLAFIVIPQLSKLWLVIIVPVGGIIALVNFLNFVNNDKKPERERLEKSINTISKLKLDNERKLDCIKKELNK